MADRFSQLYVEIIRHNEATRARVLEVMTYLGNDGQVHRAEVGLVTDFASIPFIVRWLLPRMGVYSKSAVMHDQKCKDALNGFIPRKEADDLFLECMINEGTPSWIAKPMHKAVRLAAIVRGLG